MPTVSGRQVGPVGYGLMSLTMPSFPDDDKAIELMRHALQSGCTFWDGGSFYGTHERNSLHLLRKYFEKYPEDVEKVTINIKACYDHATGADSRPEAIRKSLDTCLAQLGPAVKIHQFEAARRDPKVPIDVSVTEFKNQVDAGKIGGVALSEVNANTIREAAKVTRIDAVEVELSMFSPEPLTNGIVATCAELNIPIIAYSPVGKGLLSGEVKSFDDLPQNDMRRMFPRFQPGNFELNMKLVAEVKDMAAKRGCTPAQIAIGWLITLSKRADMPTIIPIPGSTKMERISENAGAVELSEAEMDEIKKILDKFETSGTRYPERFMTGLNQ